MKKLLLTILLVGLCQVAWGDVSILPINEYSSRVMKLEGGSYTQIGSGINYQKDDGSFAPSVAEFKPSTRTGIDWECYTTYNRVGLKNDISDGVYSVFSQLGNTGKILKSKPVALAYLNVVTKEWQIFANLQSSTAVVNGNKISYPDAFLNCDLEYVIEKDKFKQNLYIKSKSGFPASPYPASETYVVVVTKFDLANYELPTLVDANGSVAFNDIGDDASELRFSKQSFGMSDAEDALGNTKEIKKRIIKKDDVYYLLEGLPYSWLKDASYPVLLDYTTISSDVTDGNWTSGTYYVSTSINVTGLTVSSGVVIKMGSAVACRIGGTIAFNGTSSSWIYITSWNDNTVGENISGSSGSPAKNDWDRWWVQYWSSSYSFTAQNVVFRYGDYGFGVTGNTAYYSGTVDVEDCIFTKFNTSGYCYTPNNGTSTETIQDCQFNDCGTGITLNATTTAIKRCLFINNVTGFGTAYCSTSNLRNCTFDNNTNAFYARYQGTLNFYDCIFTNNGTTASDFSQGPTYNLTNCLRWNNTSNGATPTSNTAELTSANPNFATGTAVSAYIGNMTYFLNQSTSSCKDAGSDTAANLGMNTYTTATDKTLDSSTVDIGYHYEPNDVAAAGGANNNFPACAFGAGIARGIGQGMR